jgi:hypothetical protein
MVINQSTLARKRTTRIDNRWKRYKISLSVRLRNNMVQNFLN